jgi:hypothetical protein
VKLLSFKVKLDMLYELLGRYFMHEIFDAAITIEQKVKKVLHQIQHSLLFCSVLSSNSQAKRKFFLSQAKH